MSFHKIIATILVLGLSSCASTIMEGFVGRDISSVVARYGPPVAEYSLPDGRRAFQWEMRDVYRVPETTSYSEGYGDRHSSGQVTRSGGYIKEEVCYYTMYAAPTTNGGWMVVGFEKPNFDCE